MKHDRCSKNGARRRLTSTKLASLAIMLVLAITSSRAFATYPGWEVQDREFEGMTFTDAYVQSPQGNLFFICNRSTKVLSVYFQTPAPLSAEVGDQIPGRIAIPSPDLKINWVVVDPGTGTVQLQEWMIVPLLLKTGLDADGEGHVVVQVGDGEPARMPLAGFQYQGRIVAHLCGL